MPIVSRSIAERHSTSSKPESVWSDARLCLLAAAGVASVIIYGSLVPFDLRRSGALNPDAWLEQLRFMPWSRTDLFVNAAVGAPLGFFLMGALRAARRRSHVAPAVGVLVVGCLSAILGTAVEMLQLLVPMRNSSWNDVLSQGLGAVSGALAWTLTGPGVLLWLRQLANEGESSGFAARLLQLYLPIYLLVQLTPFDAVRAAELTAKYGEGRVTLVPFAYHLESTFVVLRNFAGAALLNIPLGTLAVLGWVRRGTRRAVGWAVLLGVSMVVAVGIAQELMWWRDGRMRDLLAGTLGVIIGIAAAKRLARPRVSDLTGQSRLIHPWFLVAAGAWTLALMAQYWHPFDFELTTEIVTRRLTRMSLVPFAFYYWYASYTVNPLLAVHEAVLTFVLAVPLGLLLRLALPVAAERRVRRLQGLAITIGATTVLLAIEFGQMFLPTRFPDVTDVLIGAIGAMVGDVTGRALAARRQTTGHPIRPQEAVLDVVSAKLVRTTRLLDEPSSTRP